MRRSLVWYATLLVAVCGVAATAHGVYAVALACRVPWPVAVIYPVITDGLALAAYASTTRLRAGRWYAWLIVVLAAGLSGLAQAVNLAGLGTPDARLRFGVGYWPAVAVAVGAHLLWLVGRSHETVTVAAEVRAEDSSRIYEEPTDAADTTTGDLLLLEAQVVAAHLGDRLSRRSLIAGLRERGHRVSTDRAAQLLARLRDAA